MNRKRLPFAFLAPLLFLSGCPLYYSTYDVYYMYYNNISSHDIFIQYCLDRNYLRYDGLEEHVYGVTLNSLPKMTDFEHPFNSSDYVPIEKILIVDTNTHTLLRRIEGDSFISLLPTEKWVEKKPRETVTYYRHRFVITDEFLNGK